MNLCTRFVACCLGLTALVSVGTALGAQSTHKFTYLIGGDIHGVKFRDPNIGLTAEDGGRTRRWNGTDWQISETPDGVRGQLRGIFYRTDTEAYACGDGGVFLHSTDGGQVWTWVNEFTPVLDSKGLPGRLYAIEMFDSLNGWLAGEDGIAFKTTDGGLTWGVPAGGNLHPNFQPTMHDPHDVYDLHFFDSLHGVLAADYGRLYRTSDGGLNWSEIVIGEVPVDPSVVCPEPDGANIEFWKFDFEQPSNFHSPGILVGGDGTNRGYTFRILDLFASPASVAPTQCYVGHTNVAPNCIPTMYGACLIGSSSSWRPVMTGYEQLVFSYEAQFADCACASSSACSSQLAWKVQAPSNTFANPPQWAVARKSATEAIVAGRMGMLRKFTAPVLGTVGTMTDEIAYDRARLHDGVFLTPLIGVALTQGYRLMRTTNGGVGWTEVYAASPLLPENLEGAVASGGVNNDMVVAVGKAGFVAYSSNSGQSWNVALPALSGDLRAVEFVPGTQTVFAAGLAGKVYKSDDGGASWIPVTALPATDNLIGISFVQFANTLRGYAVGTDPTAQVAKAYRSTDGGASWTPIAILKMPLPDPNNPSVPRAFNDVATWGDGTMAIAVGTDGAVYQRTTSRFEYQYPDLDPGTPVAYPTEDMFDVELVNSSANVRITGDTGRVLFRDSGVWSSPKAQTSDHVVRACFLSTYQGFIFGQKFLVCKYE